jgi:hypothetical protein
VDFANFAPYLRSNWHELSVKGDLRSQYAPFDNPPSGPQTYSYIKCETVAGMTPIQLVMRNLTSVASVAQFSYALIVQDADLYFSASAQDPAITDPPVVWTNAPFGTAGAVTVAPGGQVSANLNIATSDPIRKTLVIRALLTGAPLRVQSLSPGGAEDY